MQKLIPIAAMLIVATPASAACRRPDERSPAYWASHLTRSPDGIIIDGEVIQAEDKAHGQHAIIHPLKVYKGTVHGDLTMSLPPADGLLWTEGYFGFGNPLNSRVSFLMLYVSGDGYQTSTCRQILADDPRIRRAMLLRLRTPG